MKISLRKRQTREIASKRVVDCRKCGKSLHIQNNRMHSLREHVAADHLSHIIMFKCKLCDFTSHQYRMNETSHHIIKHHHQRNNVTEHIDDRRVVHNDTLTNAVRDCFGIIADRLSRRVGERLKSMNANKLIDTKCRKCSISVKEALFGCITHAYKHLHITPFQCRKCSSMTLRLGDMRAHIRKMHRSINDEDINDGYDDCRSKYKTQLKAALLEYFGIDYDQ